MTTLEALWQRSRVQKIADDMPSIEERCEEQWGKSGKKTVQDLIAEREAKPSKPKSGRVSLDEAIRIAARIAPNQSELIGQWVWVSKDLRKNEAARSELKAAGFRYNAKRHCWQFAGCASRGRNNPKPRIIAKYGAQVLKDEA